MRRYFNARIFLEEHFKNIGTMSESSAELDAESQKLVSNKANPKKTRSESAKLEATKLAPRESEEPVVRRMINPAPINSIQ